LFDKLKIILVTLGEGPMPPIIGITEYAAQAQWRGWSAPAALLPWTYVDAIRHSGGRPVLLPPGGSEEEAAATVADLDGIVLAGGADVNPSRYGALPHPQTVITDPDRDGWEFAVACAALRDGVPLLGICRGMQVLNVCLGGTLHQHIPDLVHHEGHSGPRVGFDRHLVRVTAGNRLIKILPGGDYFHVPTHHHQAVDATGAGLIPVGWAEDGIIEAIEGAPGELDGFVVGVQWHPEQGEDIRLFQALVDAADKHRAATLGTRPGPDQMLAGK
jgi:putative glutamine amidotransferase